MVNGKKEPAIIIFQISAPPLLEPFLVKISHIFADRMT